MSRDQPRMVAEIAALLLASAALAVALLAPRAAPVLVYDQEEIEAEVQPYIAAGFDGAAIVNQAFDRARAGGAIILRASPDIAFPDAALFRITDYLKAP